MTKNPIFGWMIYSPTNDFCRNNCRNNGCKTRDHQFHDFEPALRCSLRTFMIFIWHLWSAQIVSDLWVKGHFTGDPFIWRQQPWLSCAMGPEVGQQLEMLDRRFGDAKLRVWFWKWGHHEMAILSGYGSIPMKIQFLVGWTSIYQLFWFPPGV